MREQKPRRYFDASCHLAGCTTKIRHFHAGDFQAFWRSLSLTQQQFLRDKAGWEQMTLSAVAAEWGVEAEG